MGMMTEYYHFFFTTLVSFIYGFFEFFFGFVIVLIFNKVGSADLYFVLVSKVLQE